jgi:hypothetical protein
VVIDGCRLLVIELISSLKIFPSHSAGVLGILEAGRADSLQFMLENRLIGLGLDSCRILDPVCSVG